MGTALLALLVVSIVIGYQAQALKGRTGAGWGALTFVVIFALFAFFWPDASTFRQASPEGRENLSKVIDAFGQAGFAAIVSIIIGGGAMTLIVATLPKLNRSDG